MNLRFLVATLLPGCLLALAACSSNGPFYSPTTFRNTRITSPLPDEAFKASIIVAESPTKLRAGQPAIIKATIKNLSSNVWPAMGMDDARYAITLRDRWLTVDGNKVVNDLDGGVSLPNDVQPGAEVSMTITVKAPKNTGEYILELDLVQEQVSFFGEKGSQPTRFKVRVE